MSARNSALSARRSCSCCHDLPGEATFVGAWGALLVTVVGLIR
jgi:hypothetical protein